MYATHLMDPGHCIRGNLLLNLQDPVPFPAVWNGDGELEFLISGCGLLTSALDIEKSLVTEFEL